MYKYFQIIYNESNNLFWVCSMVIKTVGKNIRKFRKQKGITQEELAEMVSLTPNYISSIERGVYQLNYDSLVDIMNCLGCTADDLFTDVMICEYKNRSSRLSDEIEKLSPEQRKIILDVVETMVNDFKK